MRAKHIPSSKVDYTLDNVLPRQIKHKDSSDCVTNLVAAKIWNIFFCLLTWNVNKDKLPSNKCGYTACTCTSTCLYMWVDTSISFKINVNFTWVNKTISVEYTCRYQSSLINLKEVNLKIKWPSTDFQNREETKHCFLFVKSNKKQMWDGQSVAVSSFLQDGVGQNPWSGGFLHFKMLSKKLTEESFSSLHFHCFGSMLPCLHKT